MTPYFIEQYKKQNPCKLCDSNTMANRKFCGEHLVKAKLRFRAWSASRKLEGLCISCDKHSYNGFLRCLDHTKHNRLVCKLWSISHKEHLARYSREKRARNLAAGLCGKCGRYPVTGKYTRCLACRTKGRKNANHLRNP